MTKKELLKKLIKHYSKCIEDVKLINGNEKRNGYLVDNFVCQGICHCSNILFRTHIYNAAWVSKVKCDDRCFYRYWTKPPLFETKPNAIKYLQYPLDVMKEILKTCK